MDNRGACQTPTFYIAIALRPWDAGLNQGKPLMVRNSITGKGFHREQDSMRPINARTVSIRLLP
jgi:hypothetical protein